MNEIKEFTNYGYTIFRGLIGRDVTRCLKAEIDKKICKYSKDLELTPAKYTYCTGRWLLEGYENIESSKKVDIDLLQNLENKFDKKLRIQKRNITCKNQFITDAVPLHQDISYSSSSPYDFTTWVALDDIVPKSGELIVSPNSQNFKIEPAVDFWSPDFFDNKKEEFQNQVISLPLQRGDVVMFDSRLWHGSNKNLNGKDRYAYVIRWVVGDTKKPYHKNIPKPIPSKFGMWTCYEETKRILANLLSISSASNLEKLIAETSTYIKTISHCKYNKESALKDLQNLYVLHKAANNHGAGDLCGVIYKNLWHSLLKHNKL